MKIVICWSTISGYMAACWRELAERKDIEVFVLAFGSGKHNNTSFKNNNIMEGVNCRLLDHQERQNSRFIQNIIMEQEPDVLIFSGWSHPPYVRLAFEPDLQNTRRIMMMDNSRKYNLRQMLARLKIGSFLDRMDSVFVAGERSWQLAKYLRISEHKIFRGTYGIDYERFAPLLEQRMNLPEGWPKRFLFIGQYIERKGLGILAKAYQQYKNDASEP